MKRYPKTTGYSIIEIVITLAIMGIIALFISRQASRSQKISALDTRNSNTNRMISNIEKIIKHDFKRINKSSPDFSGRKNGKACKFSKGEICDELTFSVRKSIDAKASVTYKTVCTPTRVTGQDIQLDQCISCLSGSKAAIRITRKGNIKLYSLDKSAGIGLCLQNLSNTTIQFKIFAGKSTKNVGEYEPFMKEFVLPYPSGAGSSIQLLENPDVK